MEWLEPGRTVCFSGHRELGEHVEILRNGVKEALSHLIATGVHTCICGGAAGFDLLCGEVVLELRELNPALTLVLAVPCPGQDRFYTPQDRRRYKRLLDNGRQVVLSQRYHRHCMMLRNQYMVDHADYLICYLRRQTGGTYQTVTYAEMKNRKIIGL